MSKTQTVETIHKLKEAGLDPQTGLNDKEAGKLLGLAANTLKAYRSQERIHLSPPFQKIGGKVIYIKQDILAWRDCVAVRYADMEVL